MNLIRALRTKPFRATLSKPAHQHQNIALERDLTHAKQANTRTLGRHALRLGDEGESSSSVASMPPAKVIRLCPQREPAPVVKTI